MPDILFQLFDGHTQKQAVQVGFFNLGPHAYLECCTLTLLERKKINEMHSSKESATLANKKAAIRHILKQYQDLFFFYFKKRIFQKGRSQIEPRK